MTTPTETQAPLCDACSRGLKLPARYHGLDCPKRQPVVKTRILPELDLPRKRCLNCPKFYRQRKPWQKFCSTKCRRQFAEDGTAYGQLKHKLTKQIEVSCFEHSKAAAERALTDLWMTPAAIAGETRSRFHELIEQAVVRAVGDIIGAEGLEVIRAAVDRRKRKREEVEAKATLRREIGYGPGWMKEPVKLRKTRRVRRSKPRRR